MKDSKSVVLSFFILSNKKANACEQTRMSLFVCLMLE